MERDVGLDPLPPRDLRRIRVGSKGIHASTASLQVGSCVAFLLVGTKATGAATTADGGAEAGPHDDLLPVIPEHESWDDFNRLHHQFNASHDDFGILLPPDDRYNFGNETETPRLRPRPRPQPPPTGYDMVLDASTRQNTTDRSLASNKGRYLYPVRPQDPGPRRRMGPGGMGPGRSRMDPGFIAFLRSRPDLLVRLLNTTAVSDSSKEEQVRLPYEVDLLAHLVSQYYGRRNEGIDPYSAESEILMRRMGRPSPFPPRPWRRMTPGRPGSLPQARRYLPPFPIRRRRRPSPPLRPQGRFPVSPIRFGFDGVDPDLQGDFEGEFNRYTHYNDRDSHYNDRDSHHNDRDRRKSPLYDYPDDATSIQDILDFFKDEYKNKDEEYGTDKRRPSRYANNYDDRDSQDRYKYPVFSTKYTTKYSSKQKPRPSSEEDDYYGTHDPFDTYGPEIPTGDNGYSGDSVFYGDTIHRGKPKKQPSSSSTAKKNPFEIMMDIYPMDKGVYGSSFKNYYPSESNRGYYYTQYGEEYVDDNNKHHVILHLNLFSKKPGTTGFRGRGGDSTGTGKGTSTSLVFPLLGSLDPEQLYQALLNKKRSTKAPARPSDPQHDYFGSQSRPIPEKNYALSSLCSLHAVMETKLADLLDLKRWERQAILVTVGNAILQLFSTAAYMFMMNVGNFVVGMKDFNEFAYRFGICSTIVIGVYIVNSGAYQVAFFMTFFRDVFNRISDDVHELLVRRGCMSFDPFFNIRLSDTVDDLEKKTSSFEEELEKLRLKHDEVAVGFRLFEISTSKQLTVSMAFDITAAIAAYYFSFSAFLDGIAGKEIPETSASLEVEFIRTAPGLCLPGAAGSCPCPTLGCRLLRPQPGSSRLCSGSNADISDRADPVQDIHE
ncbi:unnamed protein product [Darwinula stevensoni]|uniref:Uncharacterized protein n=1 Tax=Darwinula stevensoni TaxID=69355 RepID=A0A7R9FQK5_9CRUS|nr:unnamed protein product [Darwinula stevensoni]CAG0899688.1 unnamed protein product [Darwinula stevensoni]